MKQQVIILVIVFWIAMLAEASIGRYRVPYGADKYFRHLPERAQEAASFELDCLVQHNKWRSLHQIEPLTFDAKLAKRAQERAYELVQSGHLWHEHNAKYGENLAWHSYTSTSCATLIKMWYDEVIPVSRRLGAGASIYSRSLISEAGHFTQLLWPQSRRVGCARAVAGPDSARAGLYLVCLYDPPGNVISRRFRNNYD